MVLRESLGRQGLLKLVGSLEKPSPCCSVLTRRAQAARVGGQGGPVIVAVPLTCLGGFLWLWEWPRSCWWPRVDIPLLSCAHCRAHSGLRPIEGRKSFFFVVASPCHASWLFSGGVRMIPGKMGQSSGGGAEEVTVFRYWVGMSDFSGKSGRNWKCLCHVCAVLQPHWSSV